MEPNDLRPFIPHQHGERIDNVRHMCPECGVFKNSFCTTCFGVGDVTEEQLARWVQRQNALA